MFCLKLKNKFRFGKSSLWCLTCCLRWRFLAGLTLVAVVQSRSKITREISSVNFDFSFSSNLRPSFFETRITLFPGIIKSLSSTVNLFCLMILARFLHRPMIHRSSYTLPLVLYKTHNDRVFSYIFNE